jgi:hypothetical protein
MELITRSVSTSNLLIKATELQLFELRASHCEPTLHRLACDCIQNGSDKSTVFKACVPGSGAQSAGPRDTPNGRYQTARAIYRSALLCPSTSLCMQITAEKSDLFLAGMS